MTNILLRDPPAARSRLIVPVDGSSSAQGAIDVASTLAAEHEEELLFVYALDAARAAIFS